jgi:predicted RND superfamily exporter protein
MNKVSNFIIKFRWAVIIAVIVLTAFFSYQLTTIKVDSNIINSLPNSDPDVSLFKEVGEKFGSNEIGMVIIKADNVLMPGVLDNIQLITDTLSEVEGVVGITSLTNMMSIEVTDDDFQVSSLINENNRPKNRQQADELKSKITKNDMVVGTIISKDATASVILFSYQDGSDFLKVSNEIIDKIDNLQLSEEYYFAGAPFMRTYVSRVVRHDMMMLIPIAFLLISLLLYISFHTKRGVFLPLLTAGLAIVWSMGVFALMGIKLSMVSNNVPIIILAVGTAYAIHILNRVNFFIKSDTAVTINKVLSLMIIPVSLSALTTMVGFLSFIVGSYLTLIRDFGLLAAMGTFFSALLALTFVPALLSLLPMSKNSKENEKIHDDDKSKLAQYILIPMAKRVIENPRKVLIIWIVIFIVSIGGIFNLKRSVSVAGYFKDSHAVSKSEIILSEKFGGTKPVFITFTGNIQTPEVLKAMIELEDYMKASPLIGSTQSIAGVVKKLNKVFTGVEDIPDSESAIGQFWFLLSQQESINHLVTPDADQAVIIAKFQDIGANSTTELKEYMQSYFANHTSDKYTVQMTGMPFINEKLSDNLLSSQIISIIIALILVITIVSFMLKSLKKGFYASLPTIVTIGIMYGVMGITGIPLNIATVLVASIAMGIGIDYSIHFFSYYNYSLLDGSSITKAINESISVSGKAIIINFISVSIGFLILIFSNLVPMIYFGIIIALSMFGASMGAITLLPSIILLEKRKDIS